MNGAQKSVNSSQVSDKVLLVYLHEQSSLVNPSTLWSRLSMIKRILASICNIDIKQFIKCTAFLKRQNVGLIPKKSNVLSAEQIANFMIRRTK